MSDNGRLDTAELTRVPIGRTGAFGYLETKTATAWLLAQAEVTLETGITPVITEPDGAYRTYARQVYWRTYWCARGNCGNAAIPGTSYHGWGTAVDIFNIDAYTGEHLTALLRIMTAHGFRRNVPGESWHFAFIGIDPAGGGITPITRHKRRAHMDRILKGSGPECWQLLPRIINGVQTITKSQITAAELGEMQAVGYVIHEVPDSYLSEFPTL